ncbi:MAG: hypothetical protein ACOC38_04450 [Promethearchaeia archaeon]
MLVNYNAIGMNVTSGMQSSWAYLQMRLQNLSKASEISYDKKMSTLELKQRKERIAPV